MSSPPSMSRSSRNVTAPACSIFSHSIRASHLSAVAWLRKTRYGLRRAGRGLAMDYLTPADPVSIGSLTNSRGSVILPVSALAATVSGLAR